MRQFVPELAIAATELVMSDLTDPVAARETNRLRRTADPGYPGIERMEVADRRIPGPDGEIPVRIYRPTGAVGPLPAVLWLHGGAFMLGDLDSSHATCAELSDRACAVVINVDYRLAPEHPCPAGLEDSYAALCWLVDDSDGLGVDRSRIAVVGASAGGCLAAGLVLLARDRGAPLPAFQLLLYPVLDDRAGTRSALSMKDVPVFTAASNRVMWRTYLAGATANGYYAPARAHDLAGLPPTYLLLAEHDPLRDEGLAFAAGLMAAGVRVEVHLPAGTFHGFDAVVPTASISRRERLRYADAVVAALGPAEEVRPCARP